MSTTITQESIRRRPGMYIGNLDGSGVLHMLLEVLGNAFDQHLAGRCTRIDVRVDADGTITVDDDGPGLPVRGGDGVPPIEQLLTIVSDLPTVDGHRPHAHLGDMGGFGLMVVNTLSERFELTTARDGVEATIAYARGELVTPLAMREVARAPGTRVRFRPDPAVFVNPRLSRAEMAERLEDLSFLAPGLALSWSIAGDELARGGLAAMVAMRAPCAIADVAHHRGTYPTALGPIDVEVAIAPCRSFSPDLVSFVNFDRTREHGVHVDAMLETARAMLGAGTIKGIADALCAAVALILTDVKYGKPTKDQLVSPEVHAPVADATRQALAAWEVTHAAAAAALRAKPR